MKTKTYVLIGTLVLIVAAIVYLESLKPNIPGNGLSNNINNINGNTNGNNGLLGSEFQAAPELSGISGYINANNNLTLASLKGKVVIVDFWTYSCINCLRTLPYLNAWYDKYNSLGLVIIGVHTPEFNFEKDYNNVVMATQKYDIKYPVVLDNNYATWTAYQNQYWPRKYIIDRQGNIRFDHIGEGEYTQEEQEIQQLLSENSTLTVNEPLSNVTDQTPTTDNSPETYLGWEFAVPRGENLGGQGFKPDKNFTYSKPDTNKLSKDIPYLENTWYNNNDSLVSSNDSIMYYKFTAKNANIVLDGSGTIQVFIDDKPIQKDVAGVDVEFIDGEPLINVTQPRLYEIYSGDYGTHVLKLIFSSGIGAHAFTFG